MHRYIRSVISIQGLVVVPRCEDWEFVIDLGEPSSGSRDWLWFNTWCYLFLNYGNEI